MRSARSLVLLGLGGCQLLFPLDPPTGDGNNVASRPNVTIGELPFVNAGVDYPVALAFDGEPGRQAIFTISVSEGSLSSPGEVVELGMLGVGEATVTWTAPQELVFGDLSVARAYDEPVIDPDPVRARIPVRATFGDATVPSTTVLLTSPQARWRRITISRQATLVELGAYASSDSAPSGSIALYSDAGGFPATVVAGALSSISSSLMTPSSTSVMPAVEVAAGTYWLGFAATGDVMLGSRAGSGCLAIDSAVPLEADLTGEIFAVLIECPVMFAIFEPS